MSTWEGEVLFLMAHRRASLTCGSAGCRGVHPRQAAHPFLSLRAALCGGSAAAGESSCCSEKPVVVGSVTSASLLVLQDPLGIRPCSWGRVWQHWLPLCVQKLLAKQGQLGHHKEPLVMAKAWRDALSRGPAFSLVALHIGHTAAAAAAA